MSKIFNKKFILFLTVFFALVVMVLNADKILGREKSVLFLCVHNSFRSQMAEAYFNKFAQEQGINWRAMSAGFLPAEKVNEKAILLMKEEGIDISDKKPKTLDEKMLRSADKIVVVCKECEEEGLCLVLPKDKDIEYWRFENPAKMELNEAREIRDKIKEKVLNLIDNLN